MNERRCMSVIDCNQPRLASILSGVPKRHANRRHPVGRVMRYLVLGLFAVQTLLSGCAARGTRRSAPPQTVLEVDNHSFADMTIYVINGGQRVRIGFAPGLRKTDLTIPPSMISGTRQLSFLADPLGSNRTSVSDQIYVSPGDRVTLSIPP